MTDAETSPSPTPTAELFGLPATPQPAARASGLAGLVNPARPPAQRAPENPTPDFSQLPQERGERLRVLEAILQAAEGEYANTVRAARGRFLVTGGTALKHIYDEDLWQLATDAEDQPYTSFLDYAEAVWGYKKSNVYLLLDAVLVHNALPSRDAHLDTGLVKLLAPVVRQRGKEAAAQALQETEARGPVTAKELKKTLQGVASPETTGQGASSEISEDDPESPLDALEAAIAAQNDVWRAIPPATIRKAMETDPGRTEGLLLTLETALVRTLKRTRHRPK